MFKTLVVDNEKIDRDGICFLFNKLNIPTTTVQAENGVEALEILKEQNIDILFTDIKMPVMDGLQLIHEARKINSTLKIIVYSAHSDFEYAKSAMQHGVQHYLLKPVIIEEFKSCMNQIIEECSAELIARKRSICSRLFLSDDDTPEVCELDLPGSLLLIDFSKAISGDSSEILLKTEKALGEKSVAVMLNKYQIVAFFSRSAMHCTLKMLMENLSSDYDCIVTIIDGGEYSGFEQIRELRDSMDYALDNKFYAVQNNIILLSEQNLIPSGEESQSIESLEVQLDLYIKQGEKSRVKQKINEIMQIVALNGSMSVIYTKHLAINIAKKCFAVSDLNADIQNKYLGKLLSCAQFDDMRKTLGEIADVSINMNLNNGDEIISRVLKLIEQKYKEDISLESMAERVFLTPSYLSFLFKRQTGKNFVKYLTAFRIEKSKELLDKTNLQISAISESVGYVNVSYFCLIFKNHVGLTPLQYRERNGNISDKQ